MICFSEACKKASPRAAPIAILNRVFQESGSMLGFPAQENDKENELNSNS